MELCPYSWGNLGGAEAPTGKGSEVGRYRLRQGGRYEGNEVMSCLQQ